MFGELWPRRATVLGGYSGVQSWTTTPQPLTPSAGVTYTDSRRRPNTVAPDRKLLPDLQEYVCAIASGAHRPLNPQHPRSAVAPLNMARIGGEADLLAFRTAIHRLAEEAGLDAASAELFARTGSEAARLLFATAGPADTVMSAGPSSELQLIISVDRAQAIDLTATLAAAIEELRGQVDRLSVAQTARSFSLLLAVSLPLAALASSPQVAAAQLADPHRRRRRRTRRGEREPAAIAVAAAVRNAGDEPRRRRALLGGARSVRAAAPGGGANARPPRQRAGLRDLHARRGWGNRELEFGRGARLRLCQRRDRRP